MLTSAFSPLAADCVSLAQGRISPYIHNTPVVSSSFLNERLGHEIFFKCEMFQKCGAFKTRGAFNALLSLKELGKLPEKIVSFSSGNHAQSIAKAAKILGVSATVIMPKFVSQVKQQATRSYGANLILTNSRQEAEAMAHKMQMDGAVLVHPSDDDAVIAGQGTACLEALQTGISPDAIFAPCGGGGLLSGTWLANEFMGGKASVFGVEPKMANDAAQSLRDGKIFSFSDTPMTVADGARTLHISERTFYYLKKIAGFYEVEEQEIIYWTQWLSHVLKVTVEPTSAMAMAGAAKWLKTQTGKKKVLVMLSGGNIDISAQKQIWQDNLLEKLPA